MATSTGATALNFPTQLVAEMFNAVKGHSSLARLCAAKPLPFAGATEFVFSMDGEAEIVGEAENKAPGEADFTPVTVRPVKFVYQHRVSNEFLNLTEEARIPVLQEFAAGFSAKIARGLDIAAFHGLNPKTMLASSVVGNNNFDTAVTKTVNVGSDPVDEAYESAVAAVLDNEREITGSALSPKFASAMGQIKANGISQYPEFKFGGTPERFAGRLVDINGTVNKKLSTATVRDLAIVGDFEKAFRWGYAKNIPLEVIEYGDPDGLGDLKRKNQVCLRSEAFIGWAILDAESFARIVDTVTAGQTA